MWIDSHCHINHPNIREQGAPEELVQRAVDAGVDGMLNINCRIDDEFPVLLDTAKAHKNVWCTVGTHPHEASNEKEKTYSAQDIADKVSANDNVIGIGESGLDYFYMNSTVEDQKASFQKHIEACLIADVPLVVHARDADDDIIHMLKEHAAGKGLKGIMHCFSAGRKMAEEAVEFGFHISFSGILTFKRAEELREIAKDIPKDRLLVETDAPYLAPVPYRGKTNEPSYVIHTGQVLADVLGVDVKEMAKITSDNFFNLFQKANRQDLV